jgi:hypothetical protein
LEIETAAFRVVAKCLKQLIHSTPVSVKNVIWTKYWVHDEAKSRVITAFVVDALQSEEMKVWDPHRSAHARRFLGFPELLCSYTC